jgi:YHS domain-containing protein
MNTVNRIAAAALALSLLATVSLGAQKKPAAAASCPACKMSLSKKKDKMHTVAVKIKGKTYYCCAACNMNKKKK